MTNYKYQTNENLLVEGELGVSVNNQLITVDGNGNPVILGNPFNSSPVPTDFAADAMDISNVQTLGSNFIFLNGSTFDTMGVGTYEFEEANGIVYGLYGRTNGLAQQVYFSGSQTNTSTMQYTTVPYVPPFLSSSTWQAQCVVGSDLQGFTLQLRDTTPGSTATPRYIYVRHGGSLINTSGHTYVEITSVVNNYMGAVTHQSACVPKVVRVGAYFFIALADWSNNSVWFAGWNAQDSTYPFTNAALPASSSSYTPQTFTITTSGLQGGDYTSAQTFPVLLGSNAPGGLANYQMYNMQTGTAISLSYLSAPQPATAQWTQNISVFLEGEVDGNGNPFLALGFIPVFIATNGDQTDAFLVFSIAVQFTAGSAGAYTNAQLNFVQAGSSGSSLNNQQPGGPIYVGYRPPLGYIKPNEAVPATLSNIPTCLGKLPDATYYTNLPRWWVGTPSIHWYYSGFQAFASSGSSQVVRGVTKPSGAQAGSLAAAQANKLANIYPMFNVANRADYSLNTGAQMTNSYFQPSGLMIESGNAQMQGTDILLTAAIDKNEQAFWCISKLPSGSTITDQTYNKFGTAVPGFGTRVAEYRTNLPSWQSSLSTWGAVWPTGVAAGAPTYFNFPVLTDSGPFATSVNGAATRYGQWSLVGNVYHAPPVAWTYASNMTSQLAALKAAALTAAQAASSGFGGKGVYGIEVMPVVAPAGFGFSLAVGVLHGTNSSGIGEAFFFYTSCGLSGNNINLTSTSVANPIKVLNIDQNGLIGTYTVGNDLEFGSFFVVYPTTAGDNFYVAWSQANGVNVVGDTINAPIFIEFSGNVSGTVPGGVVSVGGNNRSLALSYMSCSAQHDGLGIMPVRPGYGIPQIDIGLARYASTPITTISDIINSFTAAIANPTNYVNPNNPASDGYASNNPSEMLVLNAINNNFLLQIGSLSGRLNHKQFNLPSTFIDMTNFAQGTYYLYLVDTGAGGVQVQADINAYPESNTRMYFGKFDRTSSGFANESSVSELIRFGTARLVAGSENQRIMGSQIRIGPYVG
jgi:hypothetical protein